MTDSQRSKPSYESLGSQNTLKQPRTPKNMGSSASATATTVVSTPTHKKIYDWEQQDNTGARQESERGMLNIDGIWFKPAKCDGFYTREDYDERAQGQAKFVDLQIVLTQDELAVLAARKRAQKTDFKIDKNAAVAQSMISSTPYIEPSRVQKEMLRVGR